MLDSREVTGEDLVLETGELARDDFLLDFIELEGDISLTGSIKVDSSLFLLTEHPNDPGVVVYLLLHNREPTAEMTAEVSIKSELVGDDFLLDLAELRTGDDRLLDLVLLAGVPPLEVSVTPLDDLTGEVCLLVLALIELSGVTPLDDLTGDVCRLVLALTELYELTGVTPLDNLNGDISLDVRAGVVPLLELKLGYLPSKTSLDSQVGSTRLLSL